jgi:hypothetical protein
MKTTVCLVPLLLLLAGCGPHEPVVRFVWTPDSREATVHQTNATGSFATQYTFDTSTRKLGGHWLQDGYPEHHAELLLSEDQAARLVEHLAHIRLDTSERHGCGFDPPLLALDLVDASGRTRHFITGPESHSCGPPQAFIVEEDLLSVLDACAALLPEPPRNAPQGSPAPPLIR